jgi:hypothetical protein
MQKQFTTFKSNVESFPLGERLIGLLKPGRYHGYDTMNTLGGLNIRLQHTGTVTKTFKDNSFSNNYGMSIFSTGIVFYDDGVVNLTIATNSGNGNKRTDLIIAENTYQEVQGGTPVSYSIIQGASDGSIPSLPNPSTQILIGKMEILPNGFQFSDLTWLPERPPLPGDLSYTQLIAYINQNVTIPDATTTVKGKARLATSPEVIAGTNTDAIVVPSTLASLTSTEIRRGLSRKATQAEVIGGTNNDAFVTPADMQAALPLVNGLKQLISTDITLTASDNGKILVTSGAGGQLTITIPTGLPTNFHVGVIWNTRSAKFVAAAGTTLALQSNKLPEPSLQYNAILLESSGTVNNYFVLGNLKSV